MKQQIEPAYATFEQAKKLKEKGFNVPCVNYYTPEFTVHGFNTPLINSELGDFYSAPEQWQIVEWLFKTHSIWVEVNHCGTMNQFGYKICTLNKFNVKTEPHVVNDFGKGYNSPQKAYSAAFDYILNNLI
jgi:hypothetical protein